MREGSSAARFTSETALYLESSAPVFPGEGGWWRTNRNVSSPSRVRLENLTNYFGFAVKPDHRNDGSPHTRNAANRAFSCRRASTAGAIESTRFVRYGILRFNAVVSGVFSPLPTRTPSAGRTRRRLTLSRARVNPRRRRRRRPNSDGLK